MRALIDGDIVAYRSAFAAERVAYKIWKNEELMYEPKSKKDADEWFGSQGLDPEDFFVERYKVFAEPEVAKMAAKAIMENILKELEVNQYTLYLTGDGNFRNEVATIKGYKANRDPKDKPKYLGIVRAYLMQYWDAKIVEGMEADDQMGIEQWADYSQYAENFGCTNQLQSNTIICSIDKDLKMIPGWHYNFVKNEKVFITELEGYRNFYRQCITGDTTDNIPGLFQITGTKATKKVLLPLENAKTVGEMSKYVESLYKGHEPELYEIAELLWILQEPRGE